MKNLVESLSYNYFCMSMLEASVVADIIAVNCLLSCRLKGCS